MPRLKRRPGKPPKNPVLEFLNKHIIKVILGVSIVAIILATLIYLIASRDPSQEDPGEDANLVESETIELAMYHPRSFNVLESSDEDVFYLAPLVYSSLFTLDDTLNVQPQAVDSYTPFSNEGRVEITLRDDNGFSDGTMMTASDVVYTVNRIKEIGQASPYFRYADKIDDIEVQGDYKLVIYFKSARDAALDNLTFPIVAQSGSTGNFMTGAGPYYYADYSEGESITLKPNNYYREGVPSKPVNITIMQDKTILTGLMTMDAVTAYLYKDSDGKSLAEDRNLSAHNVVSGELEYLGFNCQRTYMDNPAVRQAIAYCVNTDQIIEDAYGGSGEITETIYYPGFLGSDVTDRILFDSKKASDILKEELGDVELSLTLIVNSQNPGRREAAAEIAEDLGKIGVQVEVIPYDTQHFPDALEAGEFDMYLGGIKMDRQFKMTELLGSGNYANFEDQEIQQLLEELEHCQSAENLTATFAKMKEALNQKMPYVPICYREYTLLTSPDWSSEIGPLYFSPYRNCENWSWKKPAPNNEDK